MCTFLGSCPRRMSQKKILSHVAKCPLRTVLCNSAELYEMQENHWCNITTSESRSRQILLLSCVRTHQRPFIFIFVHSECCFNVRRQMRSCHVVYSSCSIKMYTGGYEKNVMCFPSNFWFWYTTVRQCATVHSSCVKSCALFNYPCLFFKRTPCLYALYMICSNNLEWMMVVQTRQLLNSG